MITDVVTYSFSGPDALATGTGLKVGNTTVAFSPFTPAASTDSSPTALNFGDFTTASTDATRQAFSGDVFTLNITQNGTFSQRVLANLSGSIDQNQGLLTVSGFSPGTFTLGLDTYSDFGTVRIPPPSAFPTTPVVANVTAAVPEPATAGVLALLGAAGLLRRRPRRRPRRGA